MSSQIPSSFTSPRKKGNKKNKRSWNDDDSIRSTKSQRVKGDHTTTMQSTTADDESQLVDINATQEPRRSGRVGAGSGGRTQQLQKLEAIFEDRPVKTRRPTDLPEDTAANPLAPPAKRIQAGRRGAAKKAGLEDPPPPLYAPAGPSEAQPSTTAPVPAFHHRSSESERFGFNAPTSAPIVPPGTEPDLHALNNPYVAARKQQAGLCSLPSSEPVRQRFEGNFTVQPNFTSSRALESPLIDPALARASVSSSAQLIVPTGSNRLLPSLNPSASFRTSENPVVHAGSQPSRPSSKSLANHGRVQTAVRSKFDDSSDEGSDEVKSMTSQSEQADETGAEHEDGWGATNSRQVAHPGFSQESQPSDHVRHVSLPPEHEFTFSRDEDDQNAQRILDGTESQHQHDHRRTIDSRFTQHADAVDVLNHHHQVNGRPAAPNPQALTTFQTEEPIRTRAHRNSKKAKDSGPSPRNLGFYPAVWQDCLEDAKRECRVSHLLSNNPFPSKSRDLKTSIMEALTTTVTEWNDSGAVFEPGYWPDHKDNMACVLLGDMSTWRSDLKTTAFAVASNAYKLIPSNDIMPRERAQWVQNLAAKLLTDAVFLRDGVDELGKTNNFAHPALKEVAIRFFYTGSYRIADKRPNQFRRAIPFTCVALVGAVINCILDGFAKNGATTLKAMPQFTSKEYRSTFFTMVKMLNEIHRDPYHGRKLCNQLEKWAEEGWATLHQVDADVERNSHLQLLLD